jgi:hypothetical protein
MNMIKKILSAVSYVAIISVGVSNAHYMRGLSDRYARKDSGALHKSLLSTDEGAVGGRATKGLDLLAYKIDSDSPLIQKSQQEKVTGQQFKLDSRLPVYEPPVSKPTASQPYEYTTNEKWISNWPKAVSLAKDTEQQAREIRYLSPADTPLTDLDELVCVKLQAANNLTSTILTMADNITEMGNANKNSALKSNGQEIRAKTENDVASFRSQLAMASNSKGKQINITNEYLLYIEQSASDIYRSSKNDRTSFFEPYRVMKIAAVNPVSGAEATVRTAAQGKDALTMYRDAVRREAIPSEGFLRHEDQLQTLGEKARIAYASILNIIRVSDALGLDQVRTQIEEERGRLNETLSAMRKSDTSSIEAMDALYSWHLTNIGRITDAAIEASDAEKLIFLREPVILQPIGVVANPYSRYESIIHRKGVILEQCNVLMGKFRASDESGNVQEKKQTLYMIRNRASDAAVAFEGVPGVGRGIIQTLKETANQINGLADSLVINPTLVDKIKNYGLTILAKLKLNSIKDTMEQLKNFS